MTQPKEQADFRVIRERVSMQMILDHYGITNLKKKGDELRGPCPIHEGNKGERCFQVNVSKNIFHCFYCNAGGNVIDLVAKLEGCNIREAGLKIWQWFELGQQTISQPAQDTPLGPRTEPAPAEHETKQQWPVKFHCPDRCGGSIRKKMRFYLTSEPAFGVHGKCDQCGIYGQTEIPLNQLFKDAPTNKTVQ